MAPMMAEPEGFSTEAALCLLYIGLNVWLVLIVSTLSMTLTGNVKRRRYKSRKPMSADPNAPWCECGMYKSHGQAPTSSWLRRAGGRGCRSRLGTSSSDSPPVTVAPLAAGSRVGSRRSLASSLMSEALGEPR